MGSVGAPELLIILAVLVLIFGGAKLPKLARSMGQAQSEFKKGIKEGVKMDDASDSEPDKPATSS